MSPPRRDPRRHRRASVRFRREVSAVTQIGNGGSPPMPVVRPDLGRWLWSTVLGHSGQAAFSSAASPWEVDWDGSAQTPSKHARAPDTSMALSTMRQQASTQWHMADTIFAGQVVPWFAGRCLARRQCKWHTVHRGVSAQRITASGSCPPSRRCYVRGALIRHRTRGPSGVPLVQ